MKELNLLLFAKRKSLTWYHCTRSKAQNYTYLAEFNLLNYKRPSKRNSLDCYKTRNKEPTLITHAKKTLLNCLNTSRK